jgi:hypothetical protein
LAHYHNIICRGHIIKNLILQLTLNNYSLSLQIHRFLVVPRNLSISENVLYKWWVTMHVDVLCICGKLDNIRQLWKFKHTEFFYSEWP